MGIAVRELLALEYFKDFHVVAGRGGLHKEIQGVTMLEAPDAMKWTKGKELILSSGYVIRQDPDCIRRAFEGGTAQLASALMIKRGRYLDEIPQEILDLYEKHDVPLISMPFETAWMELMSRINTAVMNRTIRRFRIQVGNVLEVSNQSYKVQKIRKILQAVETEMQFPACLYDVGEERAYYSTPNFMKISESFGLSLEDYWNPSQQYTSYSLCDNIKMSRIRLVNRERPNDPRVSWVIIPITMGDSVQAYFIVMESREFLDYYDEFAIRIAFLTLQGVYEQLSVAQSMGNIGFENFVQYALSCRGNRTDKLVHQANMQGISMNTSYHYVLFRQTNPELSARGERATYVEMFHRSRLGSLAKMAYLDENEGLILVEAEKLGNRKQGKDDNYELLREFEWMVMDRIPGTRLTFGVGREEKTLRDLFSGVNKCRRVMDMGKRLFPERSIWEYEMLGPLAWLQTPDEELEMLLRDYRKLLADEKNTELLRTLKIYLENNMNYSLTADKMYVHINTIRKRIDKVDQMMDIDWDDHIARLRTEILLQFLDL